MGEQLTTSDVNLNDKLIETFNESEKWVIDNPQLAAEKCEEVGITVNKDVINESIKNSNLNQKIINAVIEKA